MKVSLAEVPSTVAMAPVGQAPSLFPSLTTQKVLCGTVKERYEEGRTARCSRPLASSSCRWRTRLAVSPRGLTVGAPLTKPRTAGLRLPGLAGHHRPVDLDLGRWTPPGRSPMTTRDCIREDPDIGKPACIESEAQFTLHAGTRPLYSEAFHSGYTSATLERKCFTGLGREIWLAWHLPRGWPGRDLRLTALWALLGIVRLASPEGCTRMTCEDYDPEDSMEIGEEEREVLDIVRRILRNRTDWIAQGQVLMEEIVAEVERHAARRA
jgi:hypothetical protein